MKKLAEFLLRLSGWRVAPGTPPEVARCVLTAAPHTSNWDLWYARLGMYVLGVPVRFMIKHTMMRFPFNLVIAPLGGLAIDRRPRRDTGERPSYIDAAAELFSQHDRIAVMIAPEGTRSLRTQWKTGFYYIALQAGVPICLGYLDYKNKIAGVGPAIHPSGDIDADLRLMMDFYRNIEGKHPKLFRLDERFTAG